MTRDRTDGRDEFPSRSETRSVLLSLIWERGGTLRTTTPDFSVYEELADRFGLSRDARTRRSPGSRSQTAWRSEVGYARFDLVNEGLLEDSKKAGHGIWALTHDGKERARASTLSRLRSGSDPSGAEASALAAEEAEEAKSDEGGAYSPEGIDRRPLVERQIRERRGQRNFRDALRERYGNRCLVCGCEVLAVLEAAHISPYRGESDNHPDNGLLLRADVHTLFDLDLLGIEPEKMLVELHPALEKEYSRFSGIRLNCPAGKRPSLEAMRQRYTLFRQRLRRPA